MRLAARPYQITQTPLACLSTVDSLVAIVLKEVVVDITFTLSILPAPADKISAIMMGLNQI